MKNKLFKFILTICLILVFPMLVNADMVAPESYEYDVIITNPNGATATTWEGGKEVEVIIPYNEVVTVTFEHQYEGKLTLSVNYNDNYFFYIEALQDEECDFDKLIDVHIANGWRYYDDKKMFDYTTQLGYNQKDCQVQFVENREKVARLIELPLEEKKTRKNG